MFRRALGLWSGFHHTCVLSMVCVPVCLYAVCLSLFLSVCLSVCLPVYLSVCLSVCLSVGWSVCLSARLSLTFLKTGSLAFSEIVHDDSWPRYVVTDQAIFLKKRLWQPAYLFQRASIRSKMCFFAIFLRLDHKFSLEFCTMIVFDI